MYALMCIFKGANPRAVEIEDYGFMLLLKMEKDLKTSNVRTYKDELEKHQDLKARVDAVMSQLKWISWTWATFKHTVEQ